MGGICGSSAGQPKEETAAPAESVPAIPAPGPNPIPAFIQDVPAFQTKIPQECFTSEFHQVSLDPETGTITMEPKCDPVATIIFIHGTNTFGWMQCNSFAGKGWDFSLHGKGIEHQRGGGVGKPLAPPNVRVVIPQSPNVTQTAFKDISALHDIASWFDTLQVMFEKDENGVRIPFGEERCAHLGSIFDQDSITLRANQMKELIKKEADKFEDKSTERIVLWGMSAGAAAVMATLLQWDLPTSLGGVYSNSGYVPVAKENYKMSEAALKTPVMFLYGDQDTVGRPEDFVTMIKPVAEMYSGENANNLVVCRREGLDHYYDYESLSDFFATHPKKYLEKN